MYYKGGHMTFWAKFIASIIYSISFQLKQLFVAFIPATAFPSKNCLLIRKYAAKSFNCLLCLIILLFSANHVVCVEFSNGRIIRAHLQIYECNSPQKSTPVKYMPYRNHETPHASRSDMLGAEPTCPNCIDEHIQFSKSFSGVVFSPETLTKTFFPTYQNHSFQHRILAGFSLFHKNKHVPMSDHRLATIRSTILLI
jgi:hypothetical protein